MVQREPSMSEHDTPARILVVEGSPTEARHLKIYLETRGFAVRIAATAEEAIHLLKEHAVHLILSEAELPGVSGYQFCRSLKIESPFKHTPVLLLIKVSSADDIIAGVQAGAANFVSKPID